MEELKTHQTDRPETTVTRQQPRLKTGQEPRPDEESAGEKVATNSDTMLRGFLEKREKRTTRRKWGKGLIILGIITILDSCTMFPIPLVGPPAIFAGALMILVGAAMLFEPARMKETNEALMVAVKYNNRLTVPRLALEMDISLKKAEKIIRELVRNGVAEIDLEDNHPDNGYVYKIRGI